MNEVIVKTNIVKKLVECNIAHDAIQHDPALSLQHHAMITEDAPGCLIQHLFIRDNTYGVYIVTTKVGRDINFNKIAELLNLPGAKFRLVDDAAKIAILTENDIVDSIRFCVDKSLFYQPTLKMLHPLKNDTTICVSNEAFIGLYQYLHVVEHVPTVIDFDM